MSLSFVEFVGFALPTGVAVVVGSAVQQTVLSFCDDIIAPLCSYAIRTGELDTLGVQLGEDPSVILNYGSFLQNVITFLFTVLIIYIIVIICQRTMHVDMVRKLK